MTLTIQALQTAIGTTPDGDFGPKSRAALNAHLSNPHAPAITDDDLHTAAARLGVPVGHIRGSKTVEAPRGAFDDQGRPSILYERHVFARNTVPKHHFDTQAPGLSGGPYGPGGYGSYSGQYDKLGMACALDPDAAFKACSWGAFQVLGENAIMLGYPSAYEMAKALVVSEAAHLDCYVRFIESNGLVNKLRACVPGDPISCRPFVSAYNGPGYAEFHYDVKFAQAI